MVVLINTFLIDLLLRKFSQKGAVSHVNQGQGIISNGNKSCFVTNSMQVSEC